MKYPPFDEPGATTAYHEWDDGLCRHCGKTLAETHEQPGAAASPYPVAFVHSEKKPR